MSALSRLEWLVLAVALAACPGFSWSQSSLFDRLDRNRDGYLSPAELESSEARNRSWIAVDRDRDGRISRSEFGLVGRSKPEPRGGEAAAAGGTRSPKPE